MTRLEAAEMRFLRSVKGYTRPDKIRSEVLRKELKISGKQDVRAKCKQTGSTISKEWTTPDFRNRPSTRNLEEEEILDAPGNDAYASMSEQVKRPNPWRRKKMIMICDLFNDAPPQIYLDQGFLNFFGPRHTISLCEI